jgi:uncharacterized integral membrane protein (TIGR00698 family)
MLSIKTVARGRSIADQAVEIAPGFILSAIVAVVAVYGAPYIARLVTIPAMVLALVVGIVLNPLAVRPVFQPGITFCVKKLLRWAVALLGVRIALGDIAALGWSSGILVVASMAITIVAGFIFARLLGLPAPYGALAGSATAVCGASAALATATVLPDYRQKDADVVFVVIAVNALATLAMVFYPPLAVALGFEPHVTGILLGGTIHDVAQVVGAGYAVSDTVGNTAVIVKLFRVFLLLPVVLAVGWWFARAGAAANTARVPVPVFAFAFLALCIVNSILPSTALAPAYAGIKYWLVEASTDGLLIAISALGLGTSLSSITSLGWRHMAVVIGTTLVILVVIAAALVALR